MAGGKQLASFGPDKVIKIQVYSCACHRHARNFIVSSYLKLTVLGRHNGSDQAAGVGLVDDNSSLQLLDSHQAAMDGKSRNGRRNVAAIAAVAAVIAADIVLRAGTILGPAEISWLASSSRLSAPVHRRPRVAILSTGDELVEPGAALAPGKIHDSNALAVAAAVKQIGAEPTVLGIARDEREPLRALLAEGLRADALVTSAGVSMGDRDLVRQVLDELEARQIFWKIDVKPGRPTAFAMRGGTPVFSLPGNPVSTLLTFEQFVRPALLRMMGHRKVFRPTARAVFQDDFARKPGRVQFLRVRLERRGGELLAWSAGNQDTGILKTMLQADGIAIIPAESGDVRFGSAVDVQVLRGGFEMSQA